MIQTKITILFIHRATAHTSTTNAQRPGDFFLMQEKNRTGEIPRLKSADEFAREN